MPAIVQAAGFLLISRQPPASFLLMKHPTRWDLPKGHADAGEDLLQTALRETDEETGIEADKIEVDPDFRHVVQYPVEGKKRGSYLKQVTYFLGYVAQPYSPRLTEHQDYRWFPWPPPSPLQAQTIDPLLAAVVQHLDRNPQRLM